MTSFLSCGVWSVGGVMGIKVFPVSENTEISCLLCRSLNLSSFLMLESQHITIKLSVQIQTQLSQKLQLLLSLPTSLFLNHKKCRLSVYM